MELIIHWLCLLIVIDLFYFTCGCYFNNVSHIHWHTVQLQLLYILYTRITSETAKIANFLLLFSHILFPCGGLLISCILYQVLILLSQVFILVMLCSFSASLITSTSCYGWLEKLYLHFFTVANPFSISEFNI